MAAKFWPVLKGLLIAVVAFGAMLTLTHLSLVSVLELKSLDLGCRNHGSYTRYSFPGFCSLIGMKKSMPLLTQRSGYSLFFPFLKIAMRGVG